MRSQLSVFGDFDVRIYEIDRKSTRRLEEANRVTLIRFEGEQVWVTLAENVTNHLHDDACRLEFRTNIK